MSIRKIVFVGIPALLTGCSVPAFCHHSPFLEVGRHYFHPKPNTRETVFYNFSLEEQFRVVIYMRNCVEPRDSSVAKYMALRGKEVVPFLIGKLRTADENQLKVDVKDIDRIKTSIIYIFYYMALIKTYDVQGDRALMSSMNKAVGSIKHPYLKRRTRKRIDYILSR